MHFTVERTKQHSKTKSAQPSFIFSLLGCLGGGGCDLLLHVPAHLGGFRGTAWDGDFFHEVVVVEEDVFAA